MNELRMYVEQLFTGRVLTPATIELKEEVYGNLVARYEDYRSNGLSEAEAIARTKASLTNIDDLIDGEDPGVAPRQPEAAPALGDSAASVQSAKPVSPAGEAEEPRNAEPAPAAGLDSAPATHPESIANTKPAARRKVWPFVVGAVVVILFAGLSAVGLLGGLLFVDEVSDRDTVSSQGPNSSVDGTGAPVKNGDDAITVGPDGTVWLDGNPADELVKAVVSAGPEAIAGYSGTSPNDEAAVSALARALPMSAWLADARESVPTSNQLVLTYRGVPEGYDGDSVDAAMVYNASALLIAMPTQDSVRMRVSESDDPNDYDVYTFTRGNLERQYGFGLSSDLLSSEGWKKLKEEGLYRGGFVERAVDVAEDGLL